MFPRLLALLVPLAMLAPLVTSESSAPYAPSSVVAFDGSGSAVVDWAPGEVPADSYRVYGINGGTPALLLDTATAETPGFLAVVPGGFARYAVSGVWSGTESPLVFSLAFGGTTCHGYVRLDIDPPTVTVCKTPPVEVNRLPLP